MRCVVHGVIVAVGLVSAACRADLDTSTQESNVAEGGKRYLLRDASIVLTMDPSLGDGSLLGKLENADVLIVDGRISAVGPDLVAQGAQVVDAAGKIVMPGFVDAHDHTYQSVLRGCAADAEVNVWLARCNFPFLFAPIITEADSYAAVRLSTAALVDTGVTTVADWSAPFGAPFIRGNIRGLVDSKLRFAFAMFGSAFDGSDVVALKQEFIDGNPLATLQVASQPSPFFASHVALATSVARALGIKLHVHLLENISNVAENPLAILQTAGAFALGRDLYTAHDVHVSAADIATLATLGASVAHQPLSNMRLASGIMPYPAIKAAGIRIGLGLDGSTNDTSDVFNNMRAAVGLQRVNSLDPGVSPTVSEVLRAATLGGAEALDMEDQIGSLTPGKQADVIVIDPRTLNFAPTLQAVNQIVFNGQPRNVDWVFVAGRALKEKGKLNHVNVNHVIDAAQQAADNVAPFIAP